MIRKFIMGPRIDEPVVMAIDGKKFYHHFDALGSVVTLTNQDGKIANDYRYDVYGQFAANPSGQVDTPYKFTGRRFDSESGLYYYRARMYDPGIGRFMQNDPLGYIDGLNMFAYVGNNPVNWIDPMGFNQCCEDGSSRCSDGEWGVRLEGGFAAWVVAGGGFNADVSLTCAENKNSVEAFAICDCTGGGTYVGLDLLTIDVGGWYDLTEREWVASEPDAYVYGPCPESLNANSFEIEYKAASFGLGISWSTFLGASKNTLSIGPSFGILNITCTCEIYI